MNNNYFKLLLLGLALLFRHHVSAQDRIMHGFVTTFDSIPLIGATIKVSSTKQTVESDTLGRFFIGCNSKDKLLVSAMGFYSQRIKLHEQTKFAAVNLRLKPGEKNKEYAIGYGHVNDKERLNAMSSLGSNDMDFSQYSNLYDVMRGRIPGISITSGGDIIIRGVNSIIGSSAALIVVDGVPTEQSILNSIPPVQVKSINVLKDGSTAIYGARGANGVVLIETKKGGDN